MEQPSRRSRSASARAKTRIFLAGVVFLQAADLQLSLLEGTNAVGAGHGRPHRGHDRNFLGESGVADNDFILSRNFPAWGVDDKIDIAVLDPIEHVRAALPDLEDLGYREPLPFSGPRPFRWWR